ncbi:MAG: AAA-like domain-containing protein [Byssovorax sp.]
MPEPHLYTLGGKVQASGGVYIPRAADAELLRLCRAHQLSFVLHTRQIGKSSLLAEVARVLEAEGARVAVIDLTSAGAKLVTADQWYFGLVQEIADQLGIEADVLTFWDEGARFGYTQRLRRFFTDVLLREIKGDVFVFIDEIDTTVPLDFTDDFFAGVRELYQARDREKDLARLTFVFAGSSSPDDLMRDPDRTPFNLGARIDLADFTLDEAMPLAAGLSPDPAQAKKILGFILDWTGGHPNLTQIACASVASAQASGARGANGLTSKDVEAVIAERFFGARGDEERNLAYVSEMLTTRAERLGREEVLRAYRRVLVGGRVKDDRRSRVLSHLKLAGVVQVKDGQLVVRNRIYARVFDKRWVDAHLPFNWKEVAARAFSVVLFVSLPIAVFALWQWWRASRALDELKKTNAALVTEKAARSVSDQDRDNALEFAERAWHDAEKSQRDAEHERDLAKVAKEEAEKAQRDAVDANAALQQKNAELMVTLGRLNEKNASLTSKLPELLELQGRVHKLEADLAACGKHPAPAGF